MTTDEFVNVDPLVSAYRASIAEPPEAEQARVGGQIALLCIDMNYLDAVPGYGVFADTRHGIPLESLQYYFDRLDRVVFQNVRRLQHAFRERGLEVIHTRIQSLTRDGRDRSPNHKRLGLHAAPGSKEAEFVPLVAPVGDEIVLNKTASGLFVSTNLEYVLRNLNITTLYMVGVYTNECVETTARDASDLGFFTTVVEDCCATVTEELHLSSLKTLRDRYARILTTPEVLSELTEVAQLEAGAALLKG